jgi:phosphatidylglycerol---prolipoprotein diacylglyceryl transferase
MNTLNYIVWDPSPILMTIGPIELRYYGIFFASTILIGFFLFRRILRQYGHKDKTADDFLVWGVLGVIVGARLVHCLFYEPQFYLSNPIEILKIHRGGVASHGATIGLIIAVFVFIRKNRMNFFHLSDGIVFAAAVGATLVRLGNFMNSEIVGAKTSVSWGFKFLKHSPDHQIAKNLATGNCDIMSLDCLIQYWPVRHPSQLYEAAGGLLILITMLAVSIIFSKNKRPGIYVGIFLTSYFTFRFFIEFVKEHQVFQEGIKMGQMLSIPFILFGIYAFYYAFKNDPLPEGGKKNEKK